MMMIPERFTMRWAGLGALPLLLLLSQMGQAQSVSLARDDFMQVSLQGFDGDRQNGYAWAMQWFNGQLLVGTDRAQNCTQAAQEHDQNSADPYPPTDPAIYCPPLISELPPLLQAEIWSWSPLTGAWTRVFQSPLERPGTRLQGIYSSGHGIPGHGCVYRIGWHTGLVCERRQRL